MAESSEVNTGSLVRDPQAGSVLTAPAGGQAEAVFDFVNHAPFAAAFHLEVEGLPNASWASGVGAEAQTMVAAHGGGALMMVLKPPPDVAPGNYDFHARVMSEGQPINEVPLVLTVQARGANGSAGSGETTVFDQRQQPTTLPGAPAPANGHPANGHPANRHYAAPAGEALPQADLPLVDLPGRTAEASEEAEEPADKAEPDISEPSVLDPAEGAVFSLRPGETLLLRFRFTNDTPHSRTYVIEEDRSLDSTWITLVQDEVNLTKDEADELTVRLAPPIGARPGNYPFSVRFGPEGGALTPRNLTLYVQATPAVQLTVKEPLVKVGPFWRYVEFGLAVESAGNADTAFRVAVKSPQATTDTDGSPRQDDIYETPRWRYLFDKELDNLESLTPTRPPKPRPVRLRLARKGIWWLGFRETHSMRVAAVPVTDPGNGDKPGNIADLTAVRWRPYPIPLFILLPLLLCSLLFFFGTAQNLIVDNPAYVGTDGTNYVVAQPPNGTGLVQTKLMWQAPPLALLRLAATGERYQSAPALARSPQTVDVTFPLGQRSIYRVYEVDRLLGSGGPQARIKFIAARDDTPLALTDANNVVLTAPTIMVAAAVPTIMVPTGSTAVLKLKNMAAQDYALNYWVVKRPGPAFLVSDLNDEGSLKPVPKYGEGAAQIVKIMPGPAAHTDAEDELVLVTTDLQHPVVHIALKLVFGGGRAAITP